MQSTKILWGEGLFLRPQHFQQQDEYVEALSRHALLTAQPFGWGIRELEIDLESLRNGILRVLRIEAVLPDGTPFTAPGGDTLPPPLALDAHLAAEGSKTFFLALHPVRPHGGNCTDAGAASDAHARYEIHQVATPDRYTDAVEAEIATLRKLARLKAEGEPRDQFLCLPLTRIRRTASNGFEQDPCFVPPALTLRSAPLLQTLLRRQLEALQAKVEALYGVHREPARHVVEFRSGDIASFWLLHTASSACAALAHLHRNPAIHPERVFQELLRLAGGLMTFSKRHALADLPAYDHGAPGPCFLRLDTMLRDLLDTVISTRSFSIALTETKPCFHAGRLDSDKIDANTAFLLCVSANLPHNEIIETVPQRLKLGAPDDVEKLVLSAMAGVRLTHAAQVPAAIPVRPDAIYFSLDARSPLYERMLKAQSVTIYAPDSFRELTLDLIAITP